MSRNLIKEYVDFNEKNLKEYTKKIMDKFYDEDICSKYLKRYVTVRYYNQEPWLRKDFSSHITYYLTEIYDKDKTDISKFVLELFKKYYYIEKVNDFDYTKNLNYYVEMINEIRVKKLGIKDDNFIKEFSDLLLNNEKIRQDYISNFNNSDFYLEINNVNRNLIYDVEIMHKVRVPKIFSDYAINKVWNNKLVTENKLQVEYYLLNQYLLMKIIDGKFDGNYLVDMTDTLFEKEEKLKRTFRIFDNDIAKEFITIKINYETFIKYRAIVFEYIKEGYRFAIVLDDVYLEDRSNKVILDIFKFIVITDDRYITDSIKKFNNIIYLK